MTDTITDLEKLGRNVIRLGQLPAVRKQYSLSQARLGQLIGTTGPVIAAWEARAAMAETMHAASAWNLGSFWGEIRDIAQDLLDKDIKPAQLVPLREAATAAGLSPRSPYIAEKCRTGELSCIMLGRLGLYIPATHVNIIRKAPRGRKARSASHPAVPQMRGDSGRMADHPSS